MSRPRKGSIVRRNGALYVRVTWVDPDTGRQKAKEKKINHESEAPVAIHELEKLRKNVGPEVFDGEKMTFRQLAEKYAKERHKPAVIVNGRKIEGLRSLKQSQGFLRTLVEHLGRKKIQDLTHSEIERYKKQRLATPTVRGTQRSITAVNRELEELRKALKFALQKGWIYRNPFIMGNPLINKADEPERARALSYEEEAALLAQCVGTRSHLRPVIVVGIDTFMRPSEMWRLTKKDIDFGQRLITVTAENSKTFRERKIGLTDRAFDELSRLTEYMGPDDKVFAFSSAKRSWATACRLAGVEDARIQDLRDTGITRRLEAVVRAGLPWQVVMKESGHTQIKTFMRYFEPKDGLLQESASAMTHLHLQKTAGGQETESGRGVVVQMSNTDRMLAIDSIERFGTEG